MILEVSVHNALLAYSSEMHYVLQHGSNIVCTATWSGEESYAT